ncbi:MAG: aldo/keto reductase [Clostridia bacterium]|nr:aldo/keto reductase [Clostridia bacterium]NCC44754.1 aldo/keto reductase [Clostridia bacterium]
MSVIPSLTLNTQDKMPLLGLGVYKSTGPNEVESAISHALESGYRLIDTASVYKNEEGVGRAIKAASVPREELFITTKVWNTAQRIGNVDGAFERSLERLALDYVDLYLVHWPVPGCYLETWHMLEKIYASGRAKAIGVSNFEIQNLEELFQVSGIVPAVNQIEYHPLLNQSELCKYCQDRGIAVQAYAPLARGAYFSKDTLLQIGKKYGKNPAQIGLRWMVQKGISVIPKSSQPEHIQSNSEIFDFELTDIEMMAIDALDEKFRSSGVPEDLR